MKMKRNLKNLNFDFLGDITVAFDSKRNAVIRRIIKLAKSPRYKVSKVFSTCKVVVSMSNIPSRSKMERNQDRIIDEILR